MKGLAAAIVATLSLLTACGRDEKPAPAPAPAPAAPAPTPAATPAEAPKPPVEAPKTPPDAPKPTTEVDMDAAIQELFARPEDSVSNIEIQHILIGFQGAPRLRNVTRSKEEAKALAEKVYAEAVGGADFDALVKQHTNDSAPGIYPLDQQSRAGMVKSFGDVGWRLKVGEIGVAPWDAAASPFGWHIIKRLK